MKQCQVGFLEYRDVIAFDYRGERVTGLIIGISNTTTATGWRISIDIEDKDGRTYTDAYRHSLEYMDIIKVYDENNPARTRNYPQNNIIREVLSMKLTADECWTLQLLKNAKDTSHNAKNLIERILSQSKVTGNTIYLIPDDLTIPACLPVISITTHVDRTLFFDNETRTLGFVKPHMYSDDIKVAEKEANRLREQKIKELEASISEKYRTELQLIQKLKDAMESK